MGAAAAAAAGEAFEQDEEAEAEEAEEAPETGESLFLVRLTEAARRGWLSSMGTWLRRSSLKPI